MAEDANVPGKSKIIFAILAHDNEHVLASQIRNIRHFNPDSEVVLYNGGPNKHFGENLGVSICPYSKPLSYEYLGAFLPDIARWLEEKQVDYQYLVNLDHDILFIKHGYGSFLDEMMAGFDCMGWELTISHNPAEFGVFSSKAIPSMWTEWHRWQPFFGIDHFLWYFNPGQVYRKALVQKILANMNFDELDKLLSVTGVTAVEEMLFVTMARACGANIRSYLNDGLGVVAWEENIPLSKVRQAVDHPYYYWIHPIKGDKLIELNDKLLSGDLGPDDDASNSSLSPSAPSPSPSTPGPTPGPTPDPTPNSSKPVKKKRSRRKRVQARLKRRQNIKKKQKKQKKQKVRKIRKVQKVRKIQKLRKKHTNRNKVKKMNKRRKVIITIKRKQKPRLIPKRKPATNQKHKLTKPLMQKKAVIGKRHRARPVIRKTG